MARVDCKSTAGIPDSLVAFDAVATSASVNKVEVVQSQMGIERLGCEVVEVELGSDLAPRLALQTVHTTEVKLIA